MESVQLMRDFSGKAAQGGVHVDCHEYLQNVYEDEIIAVRYVYFMKNKMLHIPFSCSKNILTYEF